jgi:hypothetical protein
MTMNRIFVSLCWFGGIVLPPGSRSGIAEIDKIPSEKMPLRSASALGDVSFLSTNEVAEIREHADEEIRELFGSTPTLFHLRLDLSRSIW